jgi:hypothetical protein
MRLKQIGNTLLMINKETSMIHGLENGYERKLVCMRGTRRFYGGSPEADQ